MNDDNYLNLTEEGIVEVNPTASSDAQQAFIDTYRQIQGENTAQIGEAAHALGSDLPAQLGGLHGPSEYMKSRYQTPQTESRVAGLRTAAQLSALNQLMANDQAKWKEKYNQAYRSAQKRERARQKQLYDRLYGGGGNGGNGDQLGVDTLSGNDTLQTNEWNPGPGSLVPSGVDQNGATTYSYTDPISGKSYILQNPSVAYNTTTNQSSSLGLWPDGSKMTPGSTYTQGGNVYTYVVSGDGRGKVYQRTYDFGG